jgi:pimeloyl-ACP methyl ester carboxylesterase
VSLTLVLSLAVGCSAYRQVAAQYPKSDISTIYENALPNAERNPVVLIHGFAGATLRRVEDGATVWGTFFTKDSLLPSKPEGLRAFALDIDHLLPSVEPEDLVAIADDTRAVELLERVKADARIGDINVEIYGALVDLMEQAGYGDCMGIPTAIADLEAPPCLTFFYDWRQDNVGNAVRLGRFLDQARGRIAALKAESGDEPGGEVYFDLVAHSMGGLLARYFLRYGAADVLSEINPPITWAGALHVDRLIMISTPNFGAMKVLRELVEGRHYPVVKFEPAMVNTFVSAYQMLPRRDHAVWLDEEGNPIEVDILSTELWEQNGWGAFAEGQDKYLAWMFPDQPLIEGRRQRMAEFMTAAFRRADRFFEVMDRRPETDCPTELTLFAADVQPTLARAILMDKDGRKVLRFDSTKTVRLKAPGDRSVTRASAVADERLLGATTGFVSSPIPWNRKVFLTDMHRTFLGNPTFQNNLLHILLETPPHGRSVSP